MLAVPGDVIHGFSYNCFLNHDFGRISGIAASRKGDILLCDYDKTNLLLVDSLGKYLKKLNVDSEPYDVAITFKNIGFVTQLKTRSVLKIDPDRMVVLMKATCNDLNTSALCASAVPYNPTVNQSNATCTCFLSINTSGILTRYGIRSYTM